MSKMISWYKQILKEIKKFDSIVIARHIGPDPDALGSSFALRELIKNNYPNKKVYAVGSPTSRFKFMGNLDSLEDVSFKDSLLIALDIPNAKRIDSVDVNLFKKVIKIDHHPFIEKYADIEYIDEEASSTSQIILEFILKNKLSLTKSIAINLYYGIVADTDRFLHDYTTAKTLKLASLLLEVIDENVSNLYEPLYLKDYNEVKFKGYIYQNLTITENHLAYIKITDETLKEYNVDSSSPGNIINDLKFVNDIIIWIFFTEDVKNNVIKANIRSRGPVINEVASLYGGGGHKYASGARLNDWKQADDMILDYDKLLKDYNN